MTRKYINEAKQHACRLIDQFPLFAEKDLLTEIIPFVDYLQRQGALLHTRYENQCSYAWACTEEYEAKTEKLENTLLKNAKAFGFAETRDVNEKSSLAFIRLQRDPRGWPIELIINGRSIRLGGKP
jgi:hypothetical protein